ncbi:DNase I-like protein [Whalleya microplaca]|nr:DNase I-like protein [Whalleya microplaca]
MPSTNRDPSVTSASEPVDVSTTHYSLSRAVNARKAEYVRPHRIRVKIGTWNVANCPGTDKDLASWFVDGKGVEPQFDVNLARLNISDNNPIADSKNNTDANSQTSTKIGDSSSETGQSEQGRSDGRDNSTQGGAEEPAVRILGDGKVGLYVLGLQEIVSLNVVQQSFYADPSVTAKWQDALEAALPKGYTLVASHQLIGLLLLIYASPEVAATISNESSVPVGTGILGLLGYMGNKGAVSSRIVLGETTRLVFSNCHLASGHDQTSLDRRCWDYNKIISSTKFAPMNQGGVVEDEGEKFGDEDFAFWFGDLNFRVDGLPGEDIRRLLTLHARGEYDVSKKDTSERLGDDGVIVLRNNEDGDGSDGSRTPGMVSREASFDNDGDDDNSELPDPDDFVPDPDDDPASVQATLNSLLPHDQLRRMMKQRKAFHEGWREAPITFLPTYKYDVGTIGLFDSSEKQRAPSWCDRILYRTRADVREYEKKCNDESDAKKKDEEMKARGIDKAVDDESVLFDYDPSTESSTSDLAYGYDEYEDDVEENTDQVVTREGYVDKLNVDIYTSHQRIMSSDHKPVAALFTLNYDAVVPELKAKVHAEVAKELDRAENEGRPGVTVLVDRKDTIGTDDKHVAEGSEGVDFGEIGFLRRASRSLTIANTGRVSASFCFVEKPSLLDDQTKSPKWLEVKFVPSLIDNEGGSEDPLGTEITLEPGETVSAVIQVDVHDLAHVRALNDETAQLEDVLVLRVTDGRDHFIPIRATWIPTCFGRSLEELIRIPRGGIRALVEQRQRGGSIPYTSEVHKSSPSELFKLIEAVETLAERVIADENMLEEWKVPRDKPGWPFDASAWQTTQAADHDELRAAIVVALEEDKPVLETIKADVPSLKRLEVVSEVLLLFLRSMPDGVVTAPLWAKIEQALPGLGSAGGSKTPAEAERDKTVVLDVLSTAPYYNISFVFLTSMLTRVANELVPLSRDELEALALRRPAPVPKRSLSFRRGAAASFSSSSSFPAAGAVDQAAVLRRVAWERRAAEIVGVAICRAALPANARERKAGEERMRAVVEVFVRRDGP